MSTAPTAEITVRPAANRWNSGPCFGVCTPGDTSEINNSDVGKALNPLHQIPFVSQLYEAATGETGSSAAKLIGGALIGGPIGFLASLADVIFTQETGKGVLSSAYAALSGDSSTQLASNAAGAQAAHLSAGVERPLVVASAIAPAAISASTQKDNDILSLYGGQAASAHQSYQKAQLLPYLQDVNSSMVL
jgi:hypothetical protein